MKLRMGVLKMVVFIVSNYTALNHFYREERKEREETL